MIIDIIQAIILGIVEGITEWLPISSTGHMILVNEFMGIKESDFFNSQIFLYVIQLGAILAIATLYFNKLNPFAPSKSLQEKKDIIPSVSEYVGVLSDTAISKKAFCRQWTQQLKKLSLKSFLLSTPSFLRQLRK